MAGRDGDSETPEGRMHLEWYEVLQRWAVENENGLPIDRAGMLDYPNYLPPTEINLTPRSTPVGTYVGKHREKLLDLTEMEVRRETEIKEERVSRRMDLSDKEIPASVLRFGTFSYPPEDDKPIDLNPKAEYTFEVTKPSAAFMRALYGPGYAFAEESTPIYDEVVEALGDPFAGRSKSL